MSILNYSCLLLLLAFGANAQTTPSTDKQVNRFLDKAAVYRMMVLEQGKLAVTKGSTDEVRNYGDLMVRDQALLLGELEKLALLENVNLPKNISTAKGKTLRRLGRATGTDFDKKFLQMMKASHKHDIMEFKSALESQDTKLAAFAEKFLPLIEEHLARVKKILKED